MAIHSKKLFIAILTIVSIVSCTNENEEQPSVVLPMEMAYSTGLPVVVINTPDSSSIISKTEWINDAVISIFSPNRQLQFQYITSIKGRGNVTWNRYPKKPYSLKLDRKRGLLGMEAAKRWVLLANWCDRTLLRNNVAFEIARRTSLEWTPHGTHVELILNNTYQGSYYLCEKIQVGKNRLNIKEIHEDNKEEDITGGYLMEIDSYFDETNKFRSKIYGLPFQFQSPDADVLTKDAFEYMEHYVNQLELQLADDNKLKNCSFNEWIDLQSFVDWWIINELCYNKDVCKPRSAYLYKDRGKSIKAGPVWDFDLGYGNTTNNGCDSPVGWHVRTSLWYRRLFEDDLFAQKVRRRFQFFYGNRNNYYSFVRRQAVSLRPHVDRNVSYEENIDELLLWLEQRLDWLNTNL